MSLPDGFTPEGRELTFDAGGVARTFTLSRKGRARTSDGRVAMTYVRKKHEWAVTVTLARGDYAAAWADDGVVDATLRKAPVSMKVTAEFGEDVRCAHLVQERYTSKAGRFGHVR